MDNNNFGVEFQRELLKCTKEELRALYDIRTDVSKPMMIKLIQGKFDLGILNIKIYELKCINPHFKNLRDGLKTFECRYNDRDYKVGDYLRLWEVDEQFVCSGDCLWYQIVHILDEFEGLKEGFVILSIKRLGSGAVKIIETKIEEALCKGK